MREELRRGKKPLKLSRHKSRLSAPVSGFSASSAKNPPRKKNEKFSSPVRVGALVGLRLELGRVLGSVL